MRYEYDGPTVAFVSFRCIGVKRNERCEGPPLLGEWRSKMPMCRNCNHWKHHSEFTCSISKICDACVAARAQRSVSEQKRKARERRRKRKIEKRLAWFNP